MATKECSQCINLEAYSSKPARYHSAPIRGKPTIIVNGIFYRNFIQERLSSLPRNGYIGRAGA
jgi:hypothetical protein